MSELRHAGEIEDYGGRLHPPVPHACPDPGTHTGLFRMVSPAEWDEMWNVDENGWPYSSGRGTRVVDPETGAVTVVTTGSEWRASGGEPLRLPAGHSLHSFKPHQVPAPGAIYLAMMPGDLETLFGPVWKLRDREFLLEVDGQPWVAKPAPNLVVSSDGDGVMALDTGGIHARTTGEWTSIDFELVRPHQ